MTRIAGKRIAVVGAGAGGLAVAGLLAKAGGIVDVYESHATAGGRMGLYQNDGFSFDTGPSWYLMPEVYDHFFTLVGKQTADYLELIKLSPAYQVFLENEAAPLIITGDEAIDAQTFEDREPGAAKALSHYLDSAEKTYALSMKYFLYHDFSRLTKLAKGAIVKHLPAMVTGAHDTLDDYVGRYFTDRGIRQVLEYPAVFLGSSPFTAPSLYHLMSYLDFRQGVYYPKGGMYSVTLALQTVATQSGATIHFNKPVANITVQNGQASGLVLQDNSVVQADIVISNADLHYTQTALLPPDAQDYPANYWKKREAGPSALLLYLGISGKLPQLQHHNLFFTKDWEANFKDIFAARRWPLPASLYVCKPSATDGTVAPKNTENLFVLVPLPADTQLNNDKLQSFADAYIEQISAQAGIPDLATRIMSKKVYGPQDFANDFNAWKGTALGLSHALKQSAMFRPRTKSKKVHGLYFVGANAQPGIGVPMCLISAELIYKDLINDRSLGPIIRGTV